MVTGRTFRRDHFLVEVAIDGNGDTEHLDVAVPVEAAVPEVGDTVGVETVTGAAVTLPAVKPGGR